MTFASGSRAGLGLTFLLAAATMLALGIEPAVGGEQPQSRAVSRERLVRTYRTTVVWGTGRYWHDHGSVTVRIMLTATGITPRARGRFPNPSPPPATTYATTALLKGARCVPLRFRRCMTISGTLNGSAIEGPLPIPDLPSTIEIASLKGRLSPLGIVSARGAMWGTGFISRGARSLELILRASRGSLKLEGQGPTVPGFTAP